MGKNTVINKISMKYFWRGMHSDVADYIGRCQCANKTRMKKPSTKLRPVPVPNRAWTQIGVDLMSFTDCETRCGNKYLMVVKCYLSKFTVVRPLQNRKAVTVATELYKLYTEYGFVATLIHDNGSEFTAKVCDELADMYARY